MISKIITPKYNSNGIFLRQVRSFVLRNKKLNKSDLQAMQDFWPLIGAQFQLKEINFTDMFHISGPVVIDIGFGTGTTLVDMAIKYPEKNFLGIEVYELSIARCLRYAIFNKVKNLKIIYHDAIEVMHYMIKNQTLSAVHLFFPDPWNKKRHYKRRIITKNFVKLILKKLIYNGMLYIVTDCKLYARYIIDMINNITGYNNLSKTQDYIPRPSWRPITKFEKKAIVAQRYIFNICFKKII
ncbi:MAG TPA: tRNA (guanosine(46)-N7)-methyltransferase TrmB [Buchnera sp. (in: enterobacteria)]|nr:tRNA (guanosine(46)-N7)-methyltransferase TrmB [Buchnera sp. (in: enterobacteria)]